jgi:hypothetical protein
MEHCKVLAALVPTFLYMSEVGGIGGCRLEMWKFIFLRESVERGKFFLRIEENNKIRKMLRCQKTQNGVGKIIQQ